MRYFPLFLDLTEKSVLVVGGGEVASRKIEALLKARAKVTVLAPCLSSSLQSLANAKRLVWLPYSYETRFVTQDYVQVWATTNDSGLNHQIHADAKQLGILVNVVDDLPYCDFITPSMISRGDIQIAISSGGSSPVLIRNLRESVEAILPQNLSVLAQFGAQKRAHIQSILPDINDRRKFWEVFFADKFVKDATTLEQLEIQYQRLVSAPLVVQQEVLWVIYQDDIELIPIKALRFMQQADLILHPDQTESACLELCRRDAERTVYYSDTDLQQQLTAIRNEYRCICILIQKEEMQKSMRLVMSGDRQFGAASYQQGAMDG